MRMIQVAAVLAVFVGCGEKKQQPATRDTTVPAPAVTPDAAVAAAPTTPTAVPDAAPVRVEPPPPAKKPGQDFIAEINGLYRVVGCGHLDQPLPEALTRDPARAKKYEQVVDRHCKTLRPQIDKYREDYFGKARAWFIDHQPKDLPKTVVYAFGGGDLVSALVAFPDATELTTISLELSGDPRRLDTLSPEQLDAALAAFRKEIGLLISVGSNLSTNLSDQQRNALASQLSSHLLGMATGGYEPVAARYFKLDDKGAIHYFTKEEIDADTKPGPALGSGWKAPAFAQSFYNVEVEYRAPNDPTIRTFRHVGWNLGDDYLKKHGQLLAHLDAKGKISICVKGASYLLWTDSFAMFRQYLIDHTAWMVTDSTGLAPNFVDPTKLEQVAYGRFDGPPTGYGFEPLNGSKADVAMRKMWAATPHKLPFRFGYLDRKGQSHIVITRPK
ncbi:MAG: hypothetical protein KIT31_33930 [Deltaproteobacteria bacterium]|nr:hypothetical protein [Deltaproteobacteria bacterium]